MCGLLLVLVGCAASPSAETGAALANSTGDSADTSCGIVLRTAYVNLQGRMGPETDCSTGTCWAVVNGTFDVAATDPTAAVLFRSARDGQWREAPASAIWGAPLGFRRYGFRITHDTFTSGAGSTLYLIPFVRTLAGGRIFDHNRVVDSLGSYTLSPDDNWQIQQDSSCPGAPPRGIRTLVFAEGWQNSGYGNLVQSGKLDLDYDIYRIPSGLGCTHDGVPTVAVTAFAQFQPGSQLLQERIDGPLGAGGKFTSIPLEFDVPANATQVALWFLDGSECNGDEWDSAWGANYVYSVGR
jgi:hypothetical protein